MQNINLEESLDISSLLPIIQRAPRWRPLLLWTSLLSVNVLMESRCVRQTEAPGNFLKNEGSFDLANKPLNDLC